MKYFLIHLSIFFFCLFTTGFAEEKSSRTSAIILVDDSTEDEADLKAMVEQYKAKKSKESKDPQPPLPAVTNSGNDFRDLPSSSKIIHQEADSANKEVSIVPTSKPSIISNAPIISNQLPEPGSIIVQDPPPSPIVVKSEPKPLRDVNKRFTWKDDTSPLKNIPTIKTQATNPLPPKKKVDVVETRQPKVERIPPPSPDIEKIENIELALNKPIKPASEEKSRGLFNIKGLFRTGLFPKVSEPLATRKVTEGNQQESGEPIHPAVTKTAIPDGLVKEPQPFVQAIPVAEPVSIESEKKILPGKIFGQR